MEVLKFRLFGDTAFFKKPDVNSNLYFTYGSIHKVALLGMFGAIVGYKGYNSRAEKEVYPEFYSELRDLKIGIVPLNKHNSVSKKVQTFNNSVGYASKELGGNLIVKEQWLENPAWEIYLALDNDKAKKISEYIIGRKSIFMPYLGKNDHIASIDEIELFKDVTLVNEFEKIDSLFIKGSVEVEIDEESEDSLYKYQERLPVALNKDTSLYEFEICTYTNMILSNTENLEVLEVNNKNIAIF